MPSQARHDKEGTPHASSLRIRAATGGRPYEGHGIAYPYGVCAGKRNGRTPRGADTALRLDWATTGGCPYDNSGLLDDFDVFFQLLGEAFFFEGFAGFFL